MNRPRERSTKKKRAIPIAIVAVFILGGLTGGLALYARPTCAQRAQRGLSLSIGCIHELCASGYFNGMSVSQVQKLTGGEVFGSTLDADTRIDINHLNTGVGFGFYDLRLTTQNGLVTSAQVEQD